MKFGLAKAVLWGLVGCTGALAVLGVLSLFDGDVARGPIIVAFAGMVFCSLCISQVAAACAQHLDHRTPVARVLAYVCAGVCGLASVAGVFLGDAVLRGDHPAMPPVWMMVLGGFVLSFVKQAMSFVIAACEGKERDRATGADAVIRAKDERIAQLERALDRALADAKKASQDKPVAQPKQSRKVTGHAARQFARAVHDAEPEAPAGRLAPVEQQLCQTEFRDVTLKEIEDACRVIAGQIGDDGAPKVPSIRLVASQCNVPRSRIDKCLVVEGVKLAGVVERLGLAAAA